MLRYILKYDIVLLSEVKTNVPFNVPGFHCYFNNSGANRHRGGCALLVKNCLVNDLASVNLSNSERIVFSFKSVPDVTFICCYIPPSDSAYYNTDAMVWINAELLNNPNRVHVVLGDMNCCFGKQRNKFLACDFNNDWRYNAFDSQKEPSYNGKLLLDTGCPQLVTLNGLHTPLNSFVSHPTYRQGAVWKSELDYCI